ncbi:MAG: DUF47 family protein [Bryobacteraceae bacterium]|nr:DUF47 family protein [Bryobacteraceae bacterium]
MRLLPREEKFFHYFQTQAKLILEASALLAEGARQSSPGVAIKIAEIEQSGDEIIHEIFQKLNATFITPLDPEDIHKLASSLDDVLDGIEEVAHKIFAYKATPLPAPAVRICEMVHSCAKGLERAMAALGEGSSVVEHCIEINRIEGEADNLGRDAVANLFESETDAIRLIKLKEIYDLLETCCDASEDVADIVQNVVVKNS